MRWRSLSLLLLAVFLSSCSHQAPVKVTTAAVTPEPVDELPHYTAMARLEFVDSKGGVVPTQEFGQPGGSARLGLVLLDSRHRVVPFEAVPMGTTIYLGRDGVLNVSRVTKPPTAADKPPWWFSSNTLTIGADGKMIGASPIGLQKLPLYKG